MNPVLERLLMWLWCVICAIASVAFIYFLYSTFSLSHLYDVLWFITIVILLPGAILLLFHR